MAEKSAILYAEAMLAVKISARNPEEKRLLVVVGARVSKKAVERNRVKRRLRALAREAGLLTALPRGKKCVIIARPEAARASFRELRTALRERAPQGGGA